MSQIEAYDYSQSGEEDFEPMWSGHPGQGGWQQGGWQHRPPVPGPWSCGCQPSSRPPWGFWGKNVALTKSIVDCMINQGMVAPGPNWQPTPSQPVTGPITGVTDGSDAGLGQVGEWLSFQTAGPSFNVPAGGDQTQSVACGVITPGDWDVQAILDFWGTVTSGWFKVSPVPTGMSPQWMGVILPASSATGANEEMFATNVARLSVSVSTSLTFAIKLSNSGSSAATGDCIVYVTARRMR